MATGLIEKEKKLIVSLLIRNIIFHLNYEHDNYTWLVKKPTKVVIYTYF